MICRNLKIINEKGLHARAAAKFVEVAETYDASVEVAKDGMTVSGDSIMGLLMLGAVRGSSIEVRTSGEQAALVAEALEALVTNRFGEEF